MAGLTESGTGEVGAVIQRVWESKTENGESAFGGDAATKHGAMKSASLQQQWERAGVPSFPPHPCLFESTERSNHPQIVVLSLGMA